MVSGASIPFRLARGPPPPACMCSPSPSAHRRCARCSASFRLCGSYDFLLNRSHASATSTIYACACEPLLNNMGGKTSTRVGYAAPCQKFGQCSRAANDGRGQQHAFHVHYGRFDEHRKNNSVRRSTTARGLHRTKPSKNPTVSAPVGSVLSDGARDQLRLGRHRIWYAWPTRS